MLQRLKSVILFCMD